MKVLGRRTCMICGKEVDVFHKARMERKVFTCSLACLGKYNSKPNNCKCDYCGKEFHKRPSEICKTNYCSRECFRLSKKIHMKGSGNHQYGLKGFLNSSWKTDEKITHYGYKKIRVLEHPYKDCNGFVFEHRLIAEKYLLTRDNSVEINGKKYLRPDMEVHHKDFDKLNNVPSNLQIMSKSEHISYHNLLRSKQNKN